MTEPDPMRAGAAEDVGSLVARMTGPTAADRGRAERGRDLAMLGRALAGSARRAGRTSVLTGGWLADLLADVAPRIPIRDAGTLRAQHPGLDEDALARVLVTGAARASGTVGAAGGALAAVEFAAPPTLLSAPAQLAAETLLVAAIEIKLIAELHEIYGVPVQGTGRERAVAYLTAWTERRGIDPLRPGSLRFSLGTAAKRSLRSRLVRRAGRNLSTLGPLMSGAVAGSIVNARETRRLAGQVQQDLRRRIVVPPAPGA